MKNIEQIAKNLNKKSKDVLNLAKTLFSKKDIRDTKYTLNEFEINRIYEHYKINIPIIENKDKNINDTDLQELKDKIKIKKDKIDKINLMDYKDLNYRILLHIDTLSELEGNLPLKKRFSLVLHHLAAHGKTTIIKTCKGNNNEGWRRSPLGGNNGMHYYLWWTNTGNKIKDNFKTDEKTIQIRDVRHHDNHDKLNPDKLENYIPLNKSNDINKDESIAKPWTAHQLNYIENDFPIRILAGYPGSGKTTVLWESIIKRNKQNTLYLTWSQDLAEVAEEYIKSFSTKNTKIYAFDYLRFLGEICRKDIERQTLKESFFKFKKTIKKLNHQILGEWKDREFALFSEIRSYIIGQACNILNKCENINDIEILTVENYLENRGKANKLGEKNAENFYKIFKKIKNSINFKEIFPEIIATKKAISNLQNNIIPDGLENINKIVIDEIQDLTLIEIQVIIEFCNLIGKRNNYLPCILIAGDEGQTVRPTGFEWGNLNNLITKILRYKPKNFFLEENLRCPQKINNLINRVSEKYTELIKSKRPAKQYGNYSFQHTNSYIHYININETDKAKKLLSNLIEISNSIIIDISNDLPDWIDNDLKFNIFSPEKAKGLEYQSVFILNLGKFVNKLNLQNKNNNINLDHEEYRIAIDHLRVAISRATETLAFIDIESNKEEIKASKQILGDDYLYHDDIEIFLSEISAEDISLEEKVNSRIERSKKLLAEHPNRSWFFSIQAYKLLGNPNLPNSINDEEIRKTVIYNILSISLKFLVNGIPADVDKKEILDVKKRIFFENEFNFDDLQNSFDYILTWSSLNNKPPFDLLNSLSKLKDKEIKILKNNISSKFQLLRQQIYDYSNDINFANLYKKNVERWLEFTGYVGDLKDFSYKLRHNACKVLLKNRKLSDAEKIISLLIPPDFNLIGELKEKQKKYKKAAENFLKANDKKSAIRNYRMIPDWISAEKLAKENEKDDLNWLIKLENHFEKMPSKLSDRLNKNEKIKIEEIKTKL